MSDKLLKDGLRTSEKIGGVPEFAELLFVRLILATCYAGRCPWSPEWIRTHALPNRPRKRLTEIAAALEALRRAHLVTRYTGHDGTAYLLIPNHGQRLKRAIRSPWPPPPAGPADAEGQTFMLIAGPPPSVRDDEPEAKVSERSPHFTSLLSSPEKKARRPKDGPVPASGPAAAPDLRLAADCLPELIAAYPRHDVPAQLRAATRYVRRQRSDETAEVTVAWFRAHWMTGAPERPADKGRRAAPAPLPSLPSEAEQLAALRALAQSPEPELGSLEHALWTQARATLREPAA